MRAASSRGRFPFANTKSAASRSALPTTSSESRVRARHRLPRRRVHECRPRSVASVSKFRRHRTQVDHVPFARPPVALGRLHARNRPLRVKPSWNSCATPVTDSSTARRQRYTCSSSKKERRASRGCAFASGGMVRWAGRTYPSPKVSDAAEEAGRSGRTGGT